MEFTPTLQCRQTREVSPDLTAKFRLIVQVTPNGFLSRRRTLLRVISRIFATMTAKGGIHEISWILVPDYHAVYPCLYNV